jgi:hypothetical protein
MFNPEYRENTFGKGALDLIATFAVGRKGSHADAPLLLLRVPTASDRLSPTMPQQQPFT